MSSSRRIAPLPCAPLVSPSPVPVVRSRCGRARCPHRAASPRSRAHHSCPLRPFPLHAPVAAGLDVLIAPPRLPARAASPLPVAARHHTLRVLHAAAFASGGSPPRPRCAPRCAVRPPLNVARPAFRANTASPSWNTRPTAHTTENACYHRTIENASICDTSTATDAANGKSSLRTRPEWHR